MFTGLIEATGTVRAVASQADGAVLELDTALGPELAPGDSLSTNGVCLTVTRRDGPHVVMDVSPGDPPGDRPGPADARPAGQPGTAPARRRAGSADTSSRATWTASGP